MKELLSYTNKIYDPVHGFIRFNDIEKDLIDSVAFQRLRHIRQLGIAFLVYPGATHTRFEHSLGAMEVATRIFDHLLKKQMRLEDAEYWKQIVRLAALCHDLGHLPFSHDGESALLGKEGHERWTLLVIESEMLKPIWDSLSAYYPHRNIVEDVMHIAVGQEKLSEMGFNVTLPTWEKVLSEIITADFFGADRIDYLLRDARCTGVAYGTFDYHQLIEMLCILPSTDTLSLGIEGNGIESCEALLLARHFMHQRVYQYSSVQACKFHLKRFMKAYYAKGDYLSSLQGYLSVSDNEILTALRSAASDPLSEGHADADAVLCRDRRFRPMEIETEMSEEMLKAMQQRLGISEEGVSWILSKKAPEKGLRFPVLMPSGCIMDAAQCSNIRIPSGKKSWLFLSPECDALRPEIQRLIHA